MDDVNLIYLDDARIEQYLNNHLDAAERESFELAMMEDPALLQRVQMLDAFKQGLLGESASLALQEPNGVREFPGSLSFRAWVRQPLSLAASVLVAGLGVQLITTSLAAPDVLPLRSVVVLEGTRGGADSVVVSGAGPYLFQVDAGLGTGAENYELSLREVATGALVIARQNLQADANGWVRVALATELQGEYTLGLAWHDAQGAAHTREFRLALNGG